MDSVILEKFELATTYQSMLKEILLDFPMIEQATSNFYKTQSQFMDTMLTVSQPTPLRMASQCLAEIERSIPALMEAFLKSKRQEILVNRKKHKLNTSTNLDIFERQLLENSIKEIEYREEHSRGYVEGAIRKILTYIGHYKSIMESITVPISEEEFEKEEERYHIMTAFTQGLCAARAHGGAIDEGNQIYLHQIGINGTQAQVEVNYYLNMEFEMAKEGEEIPHNLTIDWLNRMADKFAGCSKQYSKSRNMILINKSALSSFSELNSNDVEKETINA